jgi:GrpB-like predicted nucleotidyltransferase (UPF0157 family)
VVYSTTLERWQARKGLESSNLSASANQMDVMKELDKNVKRKYSFSEYDPNWMIQFQLIKEFLLKVFKGKALQIEHVGSTSIPGMKAKPLIDILIVVEKMEDFTKEKETMVESGYDWGADYIAPNTLIFFKLGADGEKLENIHVCEKYAPKTKQFLVMRDFFRTFPKKAQEYSDLKEGNAQRFPDDYPAYRAAKASFLDQMEQEAYRWQDERSKAYSVEP